MQSGVAINPWAYVNNPKKYALRIAALLGCESEDPKKVVDFLRTIEVTKLLQAQESFLTKEVGKIVLNKI